MSIEDFCDKRCTMVQEDKFKEEINILKQQIINLTINYNKLEQK